MQKILKRWPIMLAVLLTFACALCFWRFWAVSNLLDSQQAAQRWKGTGERDFAQLSFFLPADQKLSRDQVYSFRNDTHTLDEFFKFYETRLQEMKAYIKCPYCGYRVRANTKFCPECGKQLNFNKDVIDNSDEAPGFFEAIFKRTDD